MRAFVILACVTLSVPVATWCTRARAEGASNQAAAQALFDEGKRLMAAGAQADACPKFAESQKLDPGAGTLLNLGACYEKTGQTASAWATYTEAATAAEKSARPDWGAMARQRASALAPFLSKLSIVVPHTSEVPGLEVKRDGAFVGSGEWALPIPVDPGPHVIEASAPSKKKWTTTVQVGTSKDQVAVTVPSLEDAPGDAASIAPVPVMPGSAPSPGHPEATEAPRPNGSTQRTIGLAVAGAGVVGVVLGGVFGLKASSKNSDAKAFCTADQTRCTAAGISAVDDAKSAATISTVAFAVGAAALVGGAVLFFTAPKGSSTQAGAPSVRAAWVPGGAGLTMVGAW